MWIKKNKETKRLKEQGCTGDAIQLDMLQRLKVRLKSIEALGAVKVVYWVFT